MKCHEYGLTGHGNPEVILISYSPTKDDLTAHKLFEGSTGSLVKNTIKSSKFDINRCYFTSLLCKSEDRLLLQEQQECRLRLIKELLTLKPKLVVLLDSRVTEFFFPEVKPGIIRGAIIWSEVFQAYVMPTINPGQVFYMTKAISDLVRDLSKIKDVITWTKGHKSDILLGGSCFEGINFDIATSHSQAQTYINELSTKDFIALDVETIIGKNEDGNVDIYNDKLLSLSIGNSDHALFIPERFAQGLEFPDLKNTFHNGPFDRQMIKRFLHRDILIKFDTMFASYNLDERSGYHRLKSLAREYLGVGFYEGIHEKGQTMADVPVQKLAEYNCKDVIYTARLAPLLEAKMIVDNVIDCYYNLLIPAANMVADNQLHGVAIDEERVRKFEHEWLVRIVLEQLFLDKEARKRGWSGKNQFNVGSYVDVGNLLYKVIGLPGGPSTKAEILEELAEVDPVCARIVGARHLIHNKNNYIDGTKNNLKNDKRVHPVANLHGSETGRMSYNDPPVQTIPVPYVIDKWTYINNTAKETWSDYNVIEGLEKIRTIFCASPGYLFVEADYGKNELWHAAVMSNDLVMLADLKSGDFHSNASTTYFRVKLEDVTEAQRKDSKYVTFGQLFGRGPKEIHRQELKHLEYQEVVLMCQGFKERYKIYFNWVKKSHTIAKTTGEVQNMSGRKRRFHIVGGDKEYHQLNGAISALVQGPSSDTTLKSAIDLHFGSSNNCRLGEYESYILFLVHDAILSEVKTEHAVPAIKLIYDVMMTPKWSGMPPTEVDIKVGTAWSLGKKIKFDSSGNPIIPKELLNA